VKALGFNWQALGGFGNAAIGLATGNGFAPVPGGVPRGDAVDNLFASFRNSDVSLDVLIDALAQTNLVTILAEPSLTAQSGVPASFLAGGEYPISVPQAQGVTTIEYKKFGVSLGFTPTLGSVGRITLNVRPEVSQLTFTGGLTFNGTRVPALTTRCAETTVELASGQGFAIAGLLQASEDKDMRKFPLLGDVPVLGQLFRSQRFDRRETELVITVTPWLLQPVAATALALPVPKGWQGRGHDRQPGGDGGAGRSVQGVIYAAVLAVSHLLVSNDPALVAAINAAAARHGWAPPAVVADDAEAAETLAAAAPALLVVDLDAFADPIPAIAWLAEACNANIRVLALGSDNDAGLFRDLLALGVGDYLVKPVAAAALAAALRPLADESATTRGSLIAVIGSRGGCGTTTVATSFALIAGSGAVAGSTGCLLVDLDLHHGNDAAMFGLESGAALAAL
jgi:CheY-like chemotaxis protein